MVSGKKTVNVEFIGFTILSGMIYFSNNVVMTIIPLRHILYFYRDTQAESSLYTERAERI